MSSTELFFTEEQTPSLRFSLRVRERLCSQQTAYQKLELYEPSVCSGVFEDGRVRLRVAPGEELVASLADEIDVIIVDSTDPIGPAVPLFESPFFAACRRALRKGGIYAVNHAR